jgi:CheY-like chemotaxis protein
MKRVLVIDDEPYVARLIGAALKVAQVEHSLEYCSDGGQGRAKAAQGGYDLVALDLAMPLMDGIEALQEIKRNPKSASIPVIVVTAQHDPALHQRAMELGAAALITKPFQLEQLGDIFRRVLAGEAVEPPDAGPGQGLRPLGT